MPRQVHLLLVLMVALLAATLAHAAGAPAFQALDLGQNRSIYVWTDTCNVYVLRDGDAAILIDLGDGSVLDHLGEIGVRRIEWVLFTHHHREQCQGYAKLKPWNAKVAAPDAERSLFERPTQYRKMKPTLNDAFTVYGASYVRPPVEPIAIDRTFQKLDTFTWRSWDLRCIQTRGNSPGSMSYLLKVDDRWIAFSGDLMLDGARMHTWFDAEWDYGFAAGLYALLGSASLLESYDPPYLLPSHGPIVRNATAQLQEYQRKLRRLGKLYVRGYELNTFAIADQDPVSKPTSIPHIGQITPHLYKFKELDSWPNFAILIADSGRALVFDCGLLDKAQLDRTLHLMQDQMGLKQIDAVLITHMHGDHFLQVPHLRDKWGAKAWTLDKVAEKCQYPERFDYAAAIQTYGDGFDSLKFDRVFKSGEQFEWEGYTFTVDWMPGQTEFGCCIQGKIDGKLVAFTGDNIFASTTDPTQNGHEAVVAHNSAIFEEGYIYAANYLRKLQPDLLVGGHSWVMDRPHQLIERYADWALKIRDAYKQLSPEEDYRYMFDPYWVRAEPYRITATPGTTAEFVLNIRNFHKRSQTHRIAVHAPDGITADPPILEGQVAPESTARIPLRLQVPADAKPGLRLIAFDITLDGRRHGELFDVILLIGDPATAPASR